MTDRRWVVILSFAPRLPPLASANPDETALDLGCHPVTLTLQNHPIAYRINLRFQRACTGTKEAESHLARLIGLLDERATSWSFDELRGIGDRLTKILFPPDTIRDETGPINLFERWNAFLEKSKSDGIRFIVQFPQGTDEADSRATGHRPSLETIPFELLTFNGEFLFANQWNSLVRSSTFQRQEPGAQLTIQRDTLRALIAWASAGTDSQTGAANEQEIVASAGDHRQSLAALIGHHQNVGIAGRISRSALREALTRHARPDDDLLLCLVCHGTPGQLYFHAQDSERGLDPIVGQQLAQILRESRVRLAFLLTCYGARADSNISSVSTQLLSLPLLYTVLSSHHQLPVKQASQFIREVLTALNDPRIDGDLEAAIASTRAHQFPQNQLWWMLNYYVVNTQSFAAQVRFVASGERAGSRAKTDARPSPFPLMPIAQLDAAGRTLVLCLVACRSGLRKSVLVQLLTAVGTRGFAPPENHIERLEHSGWIEIAEPWIRLRGERWDEAHEQCAAIGAVAQIPALCETTRWLHEDLQQLSQSRARSDEDFSIQVGNVRSAYQMLCALHRHDQSLSDRAKDTLIYLSQAVCYALRSARGSERRSEHEKTLTELRNDMLRPSGTMGVKQAQIELLMTRLEEPAASRADLLTAYELALSCNEANRVCAEVVGHYADQKAAARDFCAAIRGYEYALRWCKRARERLGEATEIEPLLVHSEFTLHCKLARAVAWQSGITAAEPHIRAARALQSQSPTPLNAATMVRLVYDQPGLLGDTSQALALFSAAMCTFADLDMRADEQLLREQWARLIVKSSPTGILQVAEQHWLSDPRSQAEFIKFLTQQSRNTEPTREAILQILKYALLLNKILLEQFRPKDPSPGNIQTCEQGILCVQILMNALHKLAPNQLHKVQLQEGCLRMCAFWLLQHPNPSSERDQKIRQIEGLLQRLDPQQDEMYLDEATSCERAVSEISAFIRELEKQTC